MPFRTPGGQMRYTHGGPTAGLARRQQGARRFGVPVLPLAPYDHPEVRANPTPPV